MLLKLLILVVFPGAMALAGSSDLVTMTISNRIQLTLVAGFCLAAALSGMEWSAFASHVTAGMLALACGFAFFAFGWIGGGDAKLVAATALWFGFGDSLMEYLLVSTMIGGFLTLALLVLRGQPMPHFVARWGWTSRLLDPKGGIPYGIALAAGALVIYPQTEWMGLALH